MIQRTAGASAARPVGPRHWWPFRGSEHANPNHASRDPPGRFSSRHRPFKASASPPKIAIRNVSTSSHVSSCRARSASGPGWRLGAVAGPHSAESRPDRVKAPHSNGSGLAALANVYLRLASHVECSCRLRPLRALPPVACVAGLVSEKSSFLKNSTKT